MDDTASKENPSKDFNKLDLNQLQGFSFGTQWTQDKSAPQEGRRDDRPRREDDRPRRDGGPMGGGPKRDRRDFRKPAGPISDAPASPTNEAGAAPRGEYRVGPRRDGAGGAPRGDFRGGPRRDAGGPRGDFRGGPREGGYPERDRGPYISPFFNVIFYPEDVGFSALAKAIRTSCRTYELFEIARVIIGKNDRFIAVIQRKSPEEVASGSGAEQFSTGEIPTVKSAPMAISIPDGVPFESEEAAIAHVMSTHLGTFFDATEVEVEAPKGNYQVINKCTITGELLGPPNYHRYNQIVQQHFANRISRMSLDAFRGRIETVRDPEVVTQWLTKMKKTTRYTWKLSPEGETAPAFDQLEEARMYLLTHAKDKVAKLVDSARFHGKSLELLPQTEIRRALEGALERQRRFPLDTANALRGRLRREGFTIFKKGSKGVSYVCAVKRKFRVPGQTFSDSIGALISFIEAHPMTKASELPVKFLGIQPPQAPASAPAAEGSTVPPIQTSGTMPPITPDMATALTAEDQSKLSRLNGDLRWLVTEGYVTEFIDGRLFAPPPMTEARKQEVEKDEHDPENFPEAPQTTPPMAVAQSAVTTVAEPEAPVAAEPAAPAVAESASETSESAPKTE
ncbi:MAG: hypothetical protein IPP19_13320 [Verrucomicrobia bacterium]|nr:hypothetical protein [Verrucomicrobiota bacterium]